MNEEALALLKEIAKDGLPFRFEVIDDSAGTGQTYLDLIDTNNDDAPWRLYLEAL